MQHSVFVEVGAMMRRGLLALGFVAGLLSAPIYAQTPLEWKFTKGDAFRLQTVSTINQKMKLLDQAGKPEGKEVRQDIEYTVIMSYKVLDKTQDGNVVLETQVESMKFKKANGPLVPDEKVQGATFTISLNAKREVTDLKGYEEFIKKLASEDPTAAKTLPMIITKQALMQSAKEAFGFLPDKPAKTWTRDIESPLGPLGNLTIKNAYKDEGSDTYDNKPVQKISVESTVTYKAPTEAQSTGSPFRVVQGDLKSSEGKGTLRFDAAAGRLVVWEQKLKLKGKMSLLISGTKIDAEIDQDQTVKTTLAK
jgi:hypothetical protein